MTTLWIIESTYLKPAEDIAAITPLHREWLDQHYRSGVFITSGRKADSTGGVILAVAESQGRLQDIFQYDPFVREGCAQYTYKPFNPVKRSRVLAIEDIPLVE